MKQQWISKSSETAVHTAVNSSIACTSTGRISPIHHLHRTIGNRAVGQRLLSGTTQTKLRIGQPNDKYEREADRVADQVLRLPEPQPQHACACSGGCSKCSNEQGVLKQPQTKQIKANNIVVPAIIQQAIHSPGKALEPSTLKFMESRLGHDFSQVRVHNGRHADVAARALRARAFTLGHNLVFAAGHYAPYAATGRRLLAHELTHIVQQTALATGAPPLLQRQETAQAQQGWLPELDQILPRGVGLLTHIDRVTMLVDIFGTHALEEHVRLIHAHAQARQLTLSHGVPGIVALYDTRYGRQLDVAAARRTLMVQNTRYQRASLNRLRLVGPSGPASLPDADLARELGYELDPSSRPAPAPPAPHSPPGAPAPPPSPPPARVLWDGRTGAPGAAAARATMQAELFTAFDAYLTHFRPTTVAALARPRVAFTAPAVAPGTSGPVPTGVVDIANQARAVLEARYATTMDSAATSPRQIQDRAVRQASNPGQNIFDVSSEADRRTLTGVADLAPGVAWWLFENDVPGAAGAPGSRRFASEILAAHNYSTQDPGAEQFRWDVARAYAAASTLAPNNRRQLIDYRMTGLSERGTRGITLQSSFDPGSNRNRSELWKRWQIFQTATHESLHLRTHPAFVAAEQGRGTMKEGFVEMFTIATLNKDILPRVRAGRVEPLRRTVEGALSPATPDTTLITNRVTPPQYTAHRERAERIRDGGTPVGGAAHAGIGEAGVRAAFFQGHVEYLGLAPDGSQLPTLPAAGVAVQTRIPGGISGLNDLAQRSGVPRATIERDNPGITDTLPATAVLRGCREHWVIAGETRANIAAQHNITEVDLVRANPDIPTPVSWLPTVNVPGLNLAHSLLNPWPALTAGQKILIPAH